MGLLRIGGRRRSCAALGLVPFEGVSFSSITPPPRLPGFVWVYILEHADHSYYIRQFWDVADRLTHHRNGDGGKHPADHHEPRLVYCEGPFPLAKGIARERQLKRWSRAKKEALMRGDLTTLRALSQSREIAQPAPRGDPDLASSGPGRPRLPQSV